MKKYHAGSSDPVKSVSSSVIENDHSEKKAALIARVFYLAMAGSIVAGILALFWLAIGFGG